MILREEDLKPILWHNRLVSSGFIRNVCLRNSKNLLCEEFYYFLSIIIIHFGSSWNFIHDGIVSYRILIVDVKIVSFLIHYIALGICIVSVNKEYVLLCIQFNLIFCVVFFCVFYVIYPGWPGYMHGLCFKMNSFMLCYIFNRYNFNFILYSQNFDKWKINEL